MEKINGRTFGSNIEGLMDSETGDWKVTVRMFERRRFDGKDWEEKEVTATCTNSDFNSAYTVAMESTLMQFDDIIQNNGSQGLFDYSDEIEEELNSDKTEL